MADKNTEETRADQLVVFGCMFTCVGLAIGEVDSYGVLSLISLGLGVVLLFIAVIRSIEEDDASGEE